MTANESRSQRSARPLRVLYVEKSPAIAGGALNSLYALVSHLDRDRFEPIVVFHQENPFRENFHLLGIETRVLEASSTAGGRPSRGGKSVTKRVRLRKIGALAMMMIRDRVDVAHHNCSLSDDVDSILAGGLVGVAQISHNRTVLSPPVRAPHRLVGRAVGRFVCVSEFVANHYKGYGVPEAKTRVVYNGFNFDKWDSTPNEDVAELRRELGLKPDERVVASVGRIVAWKGQDTLLQAMGPILASHSNIRLLIVGDRLEKPEFCKKLEKLVRELGVADRVTFTGLRHDIPRILSLADVAVHSSSLPDPLPRAVVEGMLLAKPVVATDAGGVPEIIENGHTGVLVPPKEPILMGQAIQRLLQDPAEGKRLGLNARRSARSRFSIKEHVSRIQALYDEVTGS